MGPPRFTHIEGEEGFGGIVRELAKSDAILPSIERAKDALAVAYKNRDAKTAKDIRDKAEAVRVYTMRRDGSFEISNQAAEIKIRAERCLGGILIAMKAEGKRDMGGKRKSNESNDAIRLPTIEDLDIKPDLSSQCQKLATVPDEKFERQIATIKECGQLTTAETLRSATTVSGSESYDGDEWFTPSEYIEKARNVMGSIELDPASCEKANKTVGAVKFFSKKDDGLAQTWSGNVWLNPPYSYPLVENFTSKFMREDIDQGILLVNNCTDAVWFQNLLRQYPVCFTAGRISFYQAGGAKFATRQGQAFFYRGVDVTKFSKIFADVGTALVKL